MTNEELERLKQHTVETTGMSREQVDEIVSGVRADWYAVNFFSNAGITAVLCLVSLATQEDPMSVPVAAAIAMVISGHESCANSAAATYAANKKSPTMGVVGYFASMLRYSHLLIASVAVSAIIDLVLQ